MRNKGLDMGRCADPRQGDFDRNADQHERAELLNWRVLAPMSRMAPR
jgi:hypothetical protein